MSLWREIVDSLGDAVIVVSPALAPIAVNPAAETLLGASQIGHVLFAKLLQRNEWLARMVESCLKSGQSLDNPEATLVLERRQITVRAEISSLLGEQSDSKGAIILLHDLSHQKGAEQAFEADQNALRLSPAGLAHEVKNPLTGIKGAAELLATMFPADARAQQYCRLILDGVNRIASLVEQVLAVSGPHRLKHEPVNIHQVLHQALRMAGVYPEPPPGLVIEQRFDPSLPEVSGDGSALERVFLNLIRNALDAIAASQIGPQTEASSKALNIIRLRTAMETQFRLTSQGKRRQFLRVEISDSGTGMTPDNLKHLFTPFFTTKPSGTGLGLVLSQRIISLQGGKLWAECGGISNEATGATLDSGRSPAMKGQNGTTVRGMTFYVMLPVGTD